MTNVFSIAVSGLNNAVTRVANAASNIVNASSTSKLPSSPNDAYTGFEPQDVISLSNGALGGISSAYQPRNPAYFPVPDATSVNTNDDGLVAAPNVDLNVELISAKVGQVSYEANAKLIKIGERMDKALLDALE